MYHKLKNFSLMLIAMFSVGILLQSCKTLKNDGSVEVDYSSLPKWTISVNEIVKYPRATLSEREVPSYKGPPIWIRKHFEFNSKAVRNITAVPSNDKPGYFDLQMEMNRHGSLVAMRLSNDPAHPPWALLVDGVYYKSVVFNEPPLDPEYAKIIVKGPFDKSTAMFLQEYSEPNYEHLHPHE